MSSCLVPEFPAVLTALEHLSELEKEIKNAKHVYAESIFQHLTEIADLIKELEQARKNVHDLLEVETIEVSKLRFKCSNLPDEFRKEIADAVFATRNSNATQLNHLQTELKNITEEIEVTEKKQNSLKKENRFLIPGLEQLKIQHVDVIEQLNQQMAEKANKRIILNDTYDKVRGAQKAATSLKNSIEEMEEDMIKERNEFNEEKEKLMKKAEDVQNKIKVQKEKNIKKQVEMDALSAQLSDQELKTEDHQKLVYRLKSQISELRLTENHLSVQVENEMRKSKALYNEKSHLEEEMRILVERFERESDLLNAKICKIEEETQTSEALKMKRVDENTALNEKFILMQEKEDTALLRKQEITKDLQISKSHLESKLECIAKLRTEIREMKERIETLKENSQVIADMYSKQLEDYTNQFQQEHEESLSLQSRKDEVGKSLEDWKQAEAIYMNSTNAKIEANRRQCNELTDEGISLQKDINHLKEQVSLLTQQVSSMKDEYVTVETTLVTEITQLETDIADVMGKLQQDEEQLQVSRPILDDAETGYDEEKAKYEEAKKHISDLKRKKMYLEASIKDIKQNIQKLSKPKEELKLELNNLRRLIAEQLKVQTDALKNMEKDIYEVSLQLECVEVENSRLKLRNMQLKDDISTFKDEAERQMAETQRLNHMRKAIYDHLLKAWEDDSYAEKDYSERDHGILEALSQLMKKTTQRGEKINDINSKLQLGFNELATHLTSKPSFKKIVLGEEKNKRASKE